VSNKERRAYKIIFTGPVASGKTTAINMISDTRTVSTDEVATDKTKDVKANTTVAMDYGVLKIPGGEVVHLYGTPGQDRFDFMWNILVEGGLGLVLLVNNSNPTPLDDLDHFIDAFGEFISKTALVVGVTCMDKTARPGISDYHMHLAKIHKKVPVFEVDA
jgi:signal recognition particle receptor subunit beta